MNSTELFHADGRSAGVWYCSICRLVRRTQEEAEACCKPKICSRCNSVECDQYRTVCTTCNQIIKQEREAERFAKAEKLTNWDGPVYSDTHPIGSEGYAESLDAALEALESDGESEAPLEYVWLCHVRPICHLNLDHILENACQESYDDWDQDRLLGTEELQAAIDKFNELNKDEVYWTTDYKRVLLVKPALAATLP